MCFIGYVIQLCHSEYLNWKSPGAMPRERWQLLARCFGMAPAGSLGSPSKHLIRNLGKTYVYSYRFRRRGLTCWYSLWNVRPLFSTSLTLFFAQALPSNSSVFLFDFSQPHAHFLRTKVKVHHVPTIFSKSKNSRNEKPKLSNLEQSKPRHPRHTLQNQAWIRSSTN